MKRNTPDAYYAAYSWSKMDNEQRREVVKLFEKDYGADFAHRADFGNSLEKAVDRASHEARVSIAFFIQWPVWKSAGHKAPEDYDYFEKENVMRIQKKDFLLSPACEDYKLEQTPYWKKLADPEVDQGFLDFCAAL